MARLTVEDCITRIPNRFDLVMIAARRARDIHAGAELTLERDNDKNPVVALREIAEGTIDVETVRQSLIQGFHRGPEDDEPEDEEMTLVSADQAWSGVVADENPAEAEGMHEEGADFDEAAGADEAGEQSAAVTELGGFPEAVGGGEDD